MLCYLEMLDVLVVQHLLPLFNFGYRRNLASFSLFYRYYFGRCSSELAELVQLLYSHGRSTRYSDRLSDFSATVHRCFKDVHVHSFFTISSASLDEHLPKLYL